MQQKLNEQKVQCPGAGRPMNGWPPRSRDLKEGLEMVEEKARSELGMVKPNEIFVHVSK
jgi:cell division protein FtsB